MISKQKGGWLKNGNRTGDPHSASRCGAKTRRGSACQAPGMANGRCRLHGGKSTGPRTAEGLERCRRANWKHGFYGRRALAERHQLDEFRRNTAELLEGLTKGSRPTTDTKALPQGD